MTRRTSIWALAGLVGASAVLRLLAAWLRVTPELFPDEYQYAELGRSLASGGGLAIRGEAAPFPALLQPLVTAPAWLVADVGVAYRLVQAVDALVMSLAAVPVFWLARRVGGSRPLALGAAALALAVPALTYVSFVVSEPLAYPLALAAVAAAVEAIARPRRRAQLAFLLLTTLAVLARVQFLVLPLVYSAAVVLVGARERRLGRVLREQLLPLAAFAAAAALGALAGTGLLGPYSGGLRLEQHPLAALRWAGLDALALAYAGGWVVVPPALVGLWLALRRPRTRHELAFGAIVPPLALGILLEAGLLQAAVTGADVIQERYVFYLAPLLGLGFVAYASRGWPHRMAHLALAAGLLVVAVRVPLAGFATAAGVSGSPLLYAVMWLQGRLGDTGLASLAVAVAAGGALAAAAACSRAPRVATPVVAALALVGATAASAGAVAFTARNTTAVRDLYAGARPSWVDELGVRHVALLQAWGGGRTDALEQLFWNRSVDRVLLLPRAERFDRFAERRVQVGPDGSLLLGGRPLGGPLLVDGSASTVRLRGARPAGRGPTHVLWLPAGRPRIALYAPGWFADGWLGRAGEVSLWPALAGGRLAGRVVFSATPPAGAGPVRLTFRTPDDRRQVVRLRPHATAVVAIRVCAGGPWTTTFVSDTAGLVGVRVVSVHATPPRFVPDRRPCVG
jgi:hypothetical protein